jgi:hypothetical protein
MRTCPHCGAALTRPGVGRPSVHTAADLQDCLGSRELTTGEFQRRAAETLDVSRSSFYRLLERGRRDFLYRQRLADGKWIAVPKSRNGAEAGLPDQIEALADKALHE